MIKNIIFSGGGLKGWAYIGTIQALNELIKLKDIEQIVGVSIGAVFGLFYLLGISHDYLLEFIMNLNFKDIIDIDIDHILVNHSLINGVHFYNKIKEIISTKIDPNITFLELYKYNSKILYTTNALNINESKIEYFNYINTPNIKVIDAVMASSSLPFLFPAYKINNKYYYDGGLCNNCPINLINELNTIAFDIAAFNVNNSSNIKIIDLIMSLINISNKAYSNEESNIVFQILDGRFDNELININQSRDDIFNIYMTGYINSKNIIYNNFIALPEK
jgi:NTE family protein